jgi:hypothetical protein
VPRNAKGEYFSRRIDLTDPQEVGERVINARKGMQIGARLGSAVPIAGTAVGATLGAISGFILGDRETIFPIDMIAIPAYQAYMLNGTPAFQIYIKEGEVLTQVMETDAQEAEALTESVESMSTPKKRKRSKWNIYTAKKSNQIRFKSGKKKGLLNLKAMGVEYRKANKTGGKKK